MSSRNAVLAEPVDAPTRILDAAARVLRVSDRRPGIAELARQAGMSRPTVYRHFADEAAVFRALWEREIRRLMAQTPRTTDDRAGLVRQVVDLADRISTHETLARTFVTEPALVARYILDRLGTGQRVLLESLRDAIGLVQAGGSIRASEPTELAAMTLLIAQSAIQSRRMIADQLPDAAWRRELARALDGYLAP
ncbi:TetR/AcrR family transcriptional regulator [uncultured Jatrophihabitans sp.]|uniref:TetR/AcrR family transcriptional regulator n=1 Tax=uncultured Jatrophihabitans sp. TaxID=1610747 RepID=UPI0035CC5748